MFSTENIMQRIEEEMNQGKHVGYYIQEPGDKVTSQTAPIFTRPSLVPIPPPGLTLAPAPTPTPTPSPAWATAPVPAFMPARTPAHQQAYALQTQAQARAQAQAQAQAQGLVAFCGFRDGSEPSALFPGSTQTSHRAHVHFTRWLFSRGAQAQSQAWPATVTLVVTGREAKACLRAIEAVRTLDETHLRKDEKRLKLKAPLDICKRVVIFSESEQEQDLRCVREHVQRHADALAGISLTVFRGSTPLPEALGGALVTGVASDVGTGGKTNDNAKADAKTKAQELELEVELELELACTQPSSLPLPSSTLDLRRQGSATISEISTCLDSNLETDCLSDGMEFLSL